MRPIGTSSTARARATARRRPPRAQAAALLRLRFRPGSRGSPPAALPLPARRHERRRHRPRRRLDVLDHRCSHAGDRLDDLDLADLRQAQWHPCPERARDHLVLRVRDVHELRHEDGGEERGVGDVQVERVRLAERAEGRHDIPLPARRGQQRGDDLRSRPRVLDRRRPGGAHGRCTGGHRFHCQADRHGRRARATQRAGTSSTVRASTTASRPSAKSGGSSFGAKGVSAAVSGLRPSVTYHYRLVAANDQGTSRGVDATFTTLGVTVSAAVSYVDVRAVSGPLRRGAAQEAGRDGSDLRAGVRQGFAAVARDRRDGRERCLELPGLARRS